MEALIIGRYRLPNTDFGLLTTIVSNIEDGPLHLSRYHNNFAFSSFNKSSLARVPF